MPKTSDETIKRNIIEQLYWDTRVAATDVHIEISAGEVTLFGYVPSHMARQAAEEDTRMIPGVSVVLNQLKVQNPVPRHLPTDKDIQEFIAHMYVLNPNLDATSIQVTVDSGLVTLTGVVDAYWKKERAEKLAIDVSGVYAVSNKLVVVPHKTISDAAIARDVLAAIERSVPEVNTDLLDIKIVDGQVTLNGEVPTWQTSRTIQEIAQHTAGVTDVINNLAGWSL